MCVPGCEEVVRHALSRRGFFKGAAATALRQQLWSRQSLRLRKRAVSPASSISTHTMSPDFPTFFGVPGIEMQKQFDLKKDGFNLYWWRIVEHAGTHFDAPIHFSENGATADQLAVASLVVPLAVIDVSSQAAKDYRLSR